LGGGPSRPSADGGRFGRPPPDGRAVHDIEGPTGRAVLRGPQENGHDPLGGGRGPGGPAPVPRDQARGAADQTDRETHERSAAPTTGQGAGRVDDRAQDDRAQDERVRAGRTALDDPEPDNVAGRFAVPAGTGAGGPARAPDGVDDELAQELALTLVDLLSEYQDPGVPLGATRSPGIPTATPPPGHSPPAASARPARTRGGRGSAPRSARSPVPPARGSEDSGPRLADLLAEAMDVYHAAGPGGTPVDDQRAHR
jgi:hypothetical protein